MKKIIYFAVLVGLLARFSWLGQFPPGINHDELDLVISSKTYWESGHDLSGAPFPISLVKSDIQAGVIGIGAFALSPYFGIFGLSLTSARSAFVLINLLTAFFGGMFVKKITKKQDIGITFATVFLLNPWSFYYSRTALYPQISLLTMLVGLYLLTAGKKYKVLLALPFLLISVFAYPAAMISLPIIFTSITVLVSMGKKQRRPYFLLVASFALITASYIFMAKYTEGSILNSRSGEISILNTEKFENDVDISRRQSINTPLTTLTTNKLTSLTKYSLERYLRFFSPHTLFLTGDPGPNTRFIDHGLFYLIDILLLLSGAVWLVKKNIKKVNLVVTVFFVFGPLASVASSHETSYIFRSFPMLFAFSFLISLGLLNVKKFLKIPILLIYVFSFLVFLHFFFFSYTVKQAENHFLSERVLANYLIRAPGEILVADPNPSQILNQLVFFSGNTNYLKIPPNNIVFSDRCPKEENRTILINSKMDCEIEEEYIAIQDQKDSGEIYKIYNDSLCQTTALENWKRTHKISDYSIESLSNEEFCNRWIFQYKL